MNRKHLSLMLMTMLGGAVASGSALAKDAYDRKVLCELEMVRGRLASLTPREHQVLEHVVTGRLNKQIAADLGITEKTIKVHRARAMEKMGVSTLAELVRKTLEVELGTFIDGTVHDWNGREAH